MSDYRTELEQLVDDVTEFANCPEADIELLRAYDIFASLAHASNLLKKPTHTVPIQVNQNCPNCGSHNLEWVPVVRAKEGMLDDLQREDVTVLGCQDCSETIQVVDIHTVAAWLNIHARGLLNVE